MKSKIIGFIILSSLTSLTYAMDGNAHAHCYNAKGTERHNVQINSYHESYFNNDSQCNQTITVTYKICAQFMPCKIETNYYTISPHTEWRDTKKLGIMVSYNRSGKYNSSAETTITGPINRHEFSQAKVKICER